MTDEERRQEGTEEPIEDLEAPAGAQEDVAGGAANCIPPSCPGPTQVVLLCEGPTCRATTADCNEATHVIVEHLQ